MRRATPFQGDGAGRGGTRRRSDGNAATGPRDAGCAAGARFIAGAVPVETADGCRTAIAVVASLENRAVSSSDEGETARAALLEGDAVSVAAPGLMMTTTAAPPACDAR